MFVKHRFELDPYTCDLLKDMEPNFGYNGFGEFIFYRTYSRNINGEQEDWADCIIRVINGTFSIRKDWYLRNYIPWDEKKWQVIARKMAISAFKMEWLPPGRGLWAMGTDFIYERGGMACYNCFSGDTRFYCFDGIAKLNDTVGQTVHVTDINGVKQEAKVQSFGKQKLQKVIFKKVGGFSGYWYDVTKNHRWILTDGSVTTDIKIGDIVSSYKDNFIVDAIIDEGKEEEVYCVVQPRTQSFTLAGGIPTGNCAYTEIHNDLADDYSWFMDSLMLGVGVGFSPVRNDNMIFKNPKGTFEYIIPDTREGWVDSIRLKLQAYQYGASLPIPNYEKVRPAGEPIKGFGGIASGPEPLKYLHQQIDEAIDTYMTDKYYDSVMLKMDIANQIGCCVVAGNVRRSAELASLSINDPVFKDLKDYEKFPYREPWGWMSNNATDFESDDDFDQLGEVADRVILRGEPGIKNLRNFPKGRIGKNDHLRPDDGRGTNPCGEIVLCHREVCNIDETFPTVCQTPEQWYKACKYATLYATTVSLLPTHQPSTNRVVARNRRIGVGLVDFTGFVDRDGLTKVTKYLRKGYQIVRSNARSFNGEAGVPEPIRVTTVKPGGTIPKLAGKTSGVMYPNFHETLRRVRVARNHPIHKLLSESGLPYEADVVSANTDVFEYPILMGPAQPAEEISIWQQAMNLVILQREWADNAVSNTINFRPKWRLIKFISLLYGADNIYNDVRDWLIENVTYSELDAILEQLAKLITEAETSQHKITFTYDDDFELIEARIYQFDPHHEEGAIEPVLAAIAPLTKSVSLLPHSAKGAYPQMPEEGISREEYENRLSRIRPIDWSKLSDSDGIDQKYCDGEGCII